VNAIVNVIVIGHVAVIAPVIVAVHVNVNARVAVIAPVTVAVTVIAPQPINIITPTLPRSPTPLMRSPGMTSRAPALATLAALAALAACQHAQGDAPRPDDTTRPAALPPKPHPQAGVDCTQLAAALTSLELGNYAEPEDRAPREADLAATCATTALTADDAQCILGATKDSLPFCAHPVAVAHRDPPAPPAAVAVAAGLPSSCTAYIASMERMATCSALPATSRDGIRQAMNQAAAAWAQVANNPQVTAQLQAACQQGADAIKQSLTSLGC
jgi:hypothetical protein